MDKQTIVKSILETVRKEVEQWIDEEGSIKDPIEYEKRLFERTMQIGRTMLEQSRGEMSKDRNTKKKS